MLALGVFRKTTHCSAKNPTNAENNTPPPPHLWHDILSRWVDGGGTGEGGEREVERGGKQGRERRGSAIAPIRFSKPPQGKDARAAAPM